ncbi:MAG: DNA polymerase III subunit delta [Flavobacteriaceae bacterium]|nr:DNA polymerase III subunit delta [Flavobacteriaceae bacterium]
MGEEEYFIDNITNLFIQNILTKEEKEFNLNILYGKDTTIDHIISICKKYPIMSSFQIVLIKEAQDLNRSMDELISYIKKPLNSTILILNYKHKSIDKRKSIYKEILKIGKVFESKRLYDNQVQNWIFEKFTNSGYIIDKKSVILINEHLGTNLSKIDNEIEKLLLIKKGNKNIISDDIEMYIGISKEFNNFELTKAIGEKNFDKAFQIAQYFCENANSNPLVVTISVIFNFFNKLLIYHANSKASQKEMSKLLSVNPYFLAEYSTASINYNLKEVVMIISLIRDYDLYSKGVKIKKANSDLLKELITRIFNSV